MTMTVDNLRYNVCFFKSSMTCFYLVFKSLVWSGFSPFLGRTATATGFLNPKKLKNQTGTVKDRSVPVSIGSTTGLDRFSPNRMVTGLCQFGLIFCHDKYYILLYFI